jgi:acetyltransferase-like isoleucine patch superfamily enzyme
MKDRNEHELTKQDLSKKAVNRVNSILTEFEVFLLHSIGIIPSHFIRRSIYRLSGIKIGPGSTIHTGARFYNPRNIEIGRDTIIGENAVLDGRDKLIIGSHVDIASEVMIYNSEHDIEDSNFQAVQKPVTVEDYTFIGPRAIILPGITIGKGAIIAAGAVVTEDVKPFRIVGGIPAKEIGERSNKELHYKLGRAAWFR